MKVDVIGEIGAVVRMVAMRDHQGKPARVVIASRVYDAEIEDVWDAITNAERLSRWFLPVSGDLKLGGRFQLEGNAGGEILRCESPHSLGISWEFGGGVSWVNVALSENAGGTLLDLEHITPVGSEADAFWDQYGPGAVGVGWELSLGSLARHLDTGATIDPKGAEAWSLSDEGKQFARLSSEGWCKASIAAGADEAAAKAAAVRTTAFYTGEGGG